MHMSRCTCGCLRPTMGVSPPFHLTGDRHWPRAGPWASRTFPVPASSPHCGALGYRPAQLHLVSLHGFWVSNLGLTHWATFPALVTVILRSFTNPFSFYNLYSVFHSWVWLTAMSRVTVKQENWRVAPFYLLFPESFKLPISLKMFKIIFITPWS